jgi:hypothetical protein
METTVTVAQVAQKFVRIALTQLNKNNKVNASFTFQAKGENLNDFLHDTCKRIVGVMQLQKRIKENGGKNNAFGLTKSGEFELSITTATDTEQTKELNNFVFTLAQLGEQNPENVLIDLVEGYKLLTE